MVPALLFLAATSVCAPGAGTRNYIQLGVAEFRANKMDSARTCFELAMKQDPLNPFSHLYLGTMDLRKWAPGDESPQNQAFANSAKDHFQMILQTEPGDRNALSQLAMIAFRQKNYFEAKKWFAQILAEDQSDKDAWFSLGYISWVEAVQKAAPSPQIDDGIRQLQKALQLDPRMIEAMNTLSALYKLRASFQKEDAARTADEALAAEWTAKAQAAAKRPPVIIPPQR